MNTKPIEIAAATAEPKSAPSTRPAPVKADDAEAIRHRRAKVACFV